MACKFWRKIGQQLLFAARECLRCTHCSLTGATEPGNVLMKSDRKILAMKMGKGVKVGADSRKVLQKLGQSVMDLELKGTLPWQNLTLIDVLGNAPNFFLHLVLWWNLTNI